MWYKNGEGENLFLWKVLTDNFERADVTKVGDDDGDDACDDDGDRQLGLIRHHQLFIHQSLPSIIVRYCGQSITQNLTYIMYILVNGKESILSHFLQKANCENAFFCTKDFLGK